PAHPVSPGPDISVTVTALSGNATYSSPYGRKNEGFSRCGLMSRRRSLSTGECADATPGHVPMCGSP
ncbi:hypothetical protein ECEC1865_6058, partial [Escherichia coli EC1865]